MSVANIRIDQLQNEIARALSAHSRDVVAKVNISSERVGKQALKKLRARSPKRTGQYGKHWRMTTERGIGETDKRILYVADPEYRLAHLLEHGHAKRDGGRVEAKPHIRQVEEEVIQDFIKEVEEAIEGG